MRCRGLEAVSFFYMQILGNFSHFGKKVILTIIYEQPVDLDNILAYSRIHITRGGLFSPISKPIFIKFYTDYFPFMS